MGREFREQLAHGRIDMPGEDTTSLMRHGTKKRTCNNTKTLDTETKGQQHSKLYSGRTTQLFINLAALPRGIVRHTTKSTECHQTTTKPKQQRHRTKFDSHITTEPEKTRKLFPQSSIPELSPHPHLQAEGAQFAIGLSGLHRGIVGHAVVL